MRFAYLIMAHHRFDVLEELLKDLDDERNDIFLHIDKKTRKFDQNEIKTKIHKAKMYFVPRMKVYWGDYNQILCVNRLLEYAVNIGFHDYYHLMVGVEYPLKSQNYIYSFFEKNYGKEFIGFCITDTRNYINRIKYYHLESKFIRNNCFIANRWKKICGKILNFQVKLGVNRLKHNEEYYKKGYANWSITHELAKYIVSEFYKVHRQYKYSYCGDEVIFHTIVFNSSFYKNVFNTESEYDSVMRLTTWDNDKNQMRHEDLDMLIKTDKLFARKFDSDDAVELVRFIKANRK